LPAGFCKQQLWPLFHYLIPLSPSSSGRFDPVLWQAYVKANKVCRVKQSPAPAAFAVLTSPITQLQTLHMQAFSDKLVEIVSMDDDYVWIHDYHLMVCCLQPLHCILP
jgi:trehalose 6-phosphate synthase/phosphatase